MKIKLLSILLICFGLFLKPVNLNAQDKLLEIDLKKEKRDLLMYFDLKDKGMLYVTTDPGQLYHFIFVNANNKIGWENSISKKEWHSRGEVKVYYSDEYIYYTQTAETYKNGLSILQFDKSGKPVLFENNTSAFGGIIGCFTYKNKFYAVQNRYLKKNERDYNFIPFDEGIMTPGNPIKINLPYLENKIWKFIGFDENAYFYSSVREKNGDLKSTIVSFTVAGKRSENPSIKISKESFSLNEKHDFYVSDMMVDPDNHYIYTFGLFSNKSNKKNDLGPTPNHGIFINKYNFEGELINEGFLLFKDLHQTYPFVKEDQYGYIEVSIFLNPTKNSVDILTRVPIGTQNSSSDLYFGYSQIHYFKLDSSLQTKNIIYLPGAGTSGDLKRLRLEHNDFLISSILAHTTYRENKDDDLIKKLTDLTSQAKRINSNLYNIKYFEEKGIVMEYMAREKLLRVQSVTL